MHPVCVCVCACVYACLHVCLRVCVRARARACLYAWQYIQHVLACCRAKSPCDSIKFQQIHVLVWDCSAMFIVVDLI